MYLIKQLPEDFTVKERSNVDIGETGQYSYFLMQKTNYGTVRAIESIARRFRIPLRMIGFAGNKDKVAVTEQRISIKGNYSQMDNLDFKDITLTFLGKGDTPISLGDLKGNYFEIVVRNIDKTPEIKNVFVNYFGEQRFGKNNIEIGRFIVKGDFKSAVNLIDQTCVKEYIKKNPTDFVGAIKTLPKKIQMIYVHAYQSYMWNSIADIFKDRKDSIDIPIVGFGTEYGNPEVENAIKKILKQECITENDFIIRSIPELSSEGGKRDLFTEMQEIDIGKLEDDELNHGKKKILIKFFLEKGSYATVAIHSLF